MDRTIINYLKFLYLRNGIIMNYHYFEGSMSLEFPLLVVLFERGSDFCLF